MRIMKPVLVGTALAIAGMATFSVADTAFARTRNSADVPQARDEGTRPSDLGGNDRQLQGRFYKKSHKTHKTTKTSS
jgi:hypothetical protein